MRSTSSLALLLLGLTALGSAGTVVRPPPAVAGSFGIGLDHDSNPFKYSATDLDSFRRGVDPGRFPVRSADDLGLELSTDWTYRYRLGRRPGRLTAKSRFLGYASNWEKSYGFVRLGISQGIVRGGNAGASWLWMPGYLIRHYRDPSGGPDDYVACRFAEHLVTAKFEQRFGTLRLTPRYRFERDDYLGPFDYYDTDAHRMGGVVAFRPSSSFQFSVDYELKLAQAAGPVPDISYRQHGGEVRIYTSPLGRSEFSLEAAYSLALRDYTTDNSGSVDPSHAERADRIEGFSLEAGYRFGAVRLEAGYSYEWRAVTSPYSESIEDVKQYRRGRARIGVELDPGRSE